MKTNYFGSRGTKATPMMVKEIRRRYAAGESQGALSRDPTINLSLGQIGRIVRGEVWKGVTGGATTLTDQMVDAQMERFSETQTPATIEEITASQDRLLKLLANQAAIKDENSGPLDYAEVRKTVAEELAARQPTDEPGASIVDRIERPQTSEDSKG